jgi:hypothetical protein
MGKRRCRRQTVPTTCANNNSRNRRGYACACALAKGGANRENDRDGGDGKMVRDCHSRKRTSLAEFTFGHNLKMPLTTISVNGGSFSKNCTTQYAS